MSSRRILDDLFPLVTIRLLNAMNGMETASVGIRDRRKEMRSVVPADKVVVVTLVSVDTGNEAGDNATDVAEEMKNLSVSAEVMATGLGRTVFTVFTVLKLMC